MASQTLTRSQRSVQIPYLVASIVLLLILTIGANQLSKWGPSTLEFPIWAAGLGLIANIILGYSGSFAFNDPGTVGCFGYRDVAGVGRSLVWR